MRFGLILYGTEPRNRGLDQLAQTLRQLGHESFIVTRLPKSGKAITEFNSTPVIQVPSKSNSFNHLLSIPLPFNPLWIRWITRLSKKYKWDGIFVRETPLARQALAAAKKLRIPAFLDMRENLVEMYAVGDRKKLYRKLFRPKGLIRRYEAFVCPKFDHIFTVSDELREWVAENYKIDTSALSTLCNYPSKQFLREAENAFKKKYERTPNPVIKLIHTGSLKKNRGLQDIIKAIKILVSKKNPIILRIIGGGKYTGQLKQLVDDLDLGNYVEFFPMLPPQKVADALGECDIGVCAYLLNKQTHLTMPGKLFEYMAVGLPVISSARKPVIRIIEREKCGMIYPSRDPRVIADMIAAMAEDQQGLSQMGERGRKAVLKKYNQDANIEIIRNVIDKNNPKT